MFLNKALTKKFLKQAIRNNHLSVGRLENDMCVIAGSGWIINIQPYGMTNWFKSALVELIGDIPEDPGELYEYDKDGYCQVSILTERYDLSEYGNTVPYFITPLVYAENYRIVQEGLTHKFTAMRESFFRWIDASETDPDMENPPFGPNVAKDGYYIYQNGTMTVAMQAAITCTDMFDNILEALRDIDFTGEVE